MGRRADESNIGCMAEFGKLCVLREKSVAWMDCIRTDARGEVHNLFAIEEAFDRPRSDQIRLVGLLDVDAG